MLLEFPTENDWRLLVNAYPYDNLEVSKDLFPYSAHPPGSVERFAAEQDIFVWTCTCRIASLKLDGVT